jgi:uncharacterized protein
MKIGVISDTHGLIRAAALAALEGSDLIVHAGDIGSPDVLRALAAVAPVVAVRGNNDEGSWAAALPATEIVHADSSLVYVLHDRNDLDLDAAAAGVAAVVSGHSHVPRVETKAGVLYVNPGSAGPRRFRLPIAVARMRIDDAHVTAELVILEGGG